MRISGAYKNNRGGTGKSYTYMGTHFKYLGTLKMVCKWRAQIQRHQVGDMGRDAAEYGKTGQVGEWGKMTPTCPIFPYCATKGCTRKLKGNVYKTVIIPALLHGAEMYGYNEAPRKTDKIQVSEM